MPDSVFMLDSCSSSSQLLCWNLGAILRLMSSLDLRVPPPAKSHFKPQHWNYKHPERMRNTAQTKLGSFATLQQIVYYRDHFIWVFRNRNWTGRSAKRSEISDQWIISGSLPEMKNCVHQSFVCSFYMWHRNSCCSTQTNALQTKVWVT